jgi:ankyrin repeat protein
MTVALIGLGADINTRENKGRTALHCEVLVTELPDALDSIAALLEHGAEINAQDDNGQTAVHYAIDKCQFPESLDLVIPLLDGGKDMGIMARTERNAVVESGDEDIRDVKIKVVSWRRHSQEAIVSMMLKHGANVMVQDKNGRTALDLARLKAAGFESSG